MVVDVYFIHLLRYGEMFLHCKECGIAGVATSTLPTNGSAWTGSLPALHIQEKAHSAMKARKVMIISVFFEGGPLSSIGWNGGGSGQINTVWYCNMLLRLKNAGEVLERNCATSRQR